MEWNQELLERLMQTDDETLKKAVESVAMAAGAGEKQAKRLTGDMQGLRRVISGWKPSELNGLVRSVGEENLREILSGALGEELH